MSEESLREALARAEALRPQLGRAADSLNKSLEALETLLRDRGFNVAARVAIWTNEDHEGRVTEAAYLTWGKHKGRWCLTYSTEHAFAPPDFDDRVRLVDASLEERKVAAGYLAKLIKQIIRVLESQIEDIDNAAAQVDSVAAALEGDVR